MNIEEQIKEIIIKHAFPSNLLDEVKGTKLKTIVEELTNLLKQQEQEIREKVIKDFVEENRGFSYWTNLKASARRYLNQKQEEDK